MDDDLIFSETPELSAPVLVMAFKGWNDAGSSASHALEYLISQLSARKFCSMDPDHYYDFTQARPHTRPVGEYRRELTWPKNEFYYHRSSSGADAVFFLGQEPHLRWRRYSENVLSLTRRLGVSEVIALGALLADTPHTRAVPLSGGSSTPALAERLRSIGIRGSSYEGPTGILGVLGAMLTDADIANGSIWAAVPHYISATPNPKASAALLRKLTCVVPLAVAVAEMEAEAEAYGAQVESALTDNPEAQQYVRELELRHLSSPDEPELDLPPLEGSEPLDEAQAEGLIRSVEEFLRRQSDPGGGEGRG